MPTDTITFTPAPILTQWTGVTQTVREKSNVPRGEVIFRVIDGVLPAPESGDDGFLFIDMQFPQNFAYVYGEMFMRISQAVSTTLSWQACGTLLHASSLPRTIATKQVTFGEVRSSGECFDLIGRGPERIYSPTLRGETKLTYLADESGANVAASVSLGNPTVDHAAGTCNFFARYFIYDIDQALHYQVNSATLTR